MGFTGKEGEFITLEIGKDYTGNWRTKHGDEAIRAHFFGKEKLMQLMEDESVMGIRIYQGLHQDSLKLVLVGTDKDENDITEGENRILDAGVPCPPSCDQGTLGGG